MLRGLRRRKEAVGSALGEKGGGPGSLSPCKPLAGEVEGRCVYKHQLSFSFHSPLTTFFLFLCL